MKEFTAKSIADKIDVGYVLTKITDKMWNSFVGDFRKAARQGAIDANCIDNVEERPTHVLDLYKNRRGRLKDVRIWTKLDLGNGYRKDCFITTPSNVPIDIKYQFQTRTEIVNWRELLEKGIEEI